MFDHSILTSTIILNVNCAHLSKDHFHKIFISIFCASHNRFANSTPTSLIRGASFIYTCVIILNMNGVFIAFYTPIIVVKAIVWIAGLIFIAAEHLFLIFLSFCCYHWGCAHLCVLSYHLSWTIIIKEFRLILIREILLFVIICKVFLPASWMLFSIWSAFRIGFWLFEKL